MLIPGSIHRRYPALTQKNPLGRWISSPKGGCGWLRRRVRRPKRRINRRAFSGNRGSGRSGDFQGVLTTPDAGDAGSAAAAPSGCSGGCEVPDTAFLSPAAAAAPPGTGASGRRFCGSPPGRQGTGTDREAWNPSYRILGRRAGRPPFYAALMIPPGGAPPLSRLCKVLVKPLRAQVPAEPAYECLGAGMRVFRADARGFPVESEECKIFGIKNAGKT